MPLAPSLRQSPLQQRSTRTSMTRRHCTPYEMTSLQEMVSKGSQLRMTELFGWFFDEIYADVWYSILDIFHYFQGSVKRPTGMKPEPCMAQNSSLFKSTGSGPFLNANHPMLDAANFGWHPFLRLHLQFWLLKSPFRCSHPCIPFQNYPRIVIGHIPLYPIIVC